MRPLTTILAGVGVAVIIGSTLAGCSAAAQGASERAAVQRAVTLPGVSCGSAVTRFQDGRAELQSANPGALGCFDAAVRHCRAARITVTVMAVDTGSHENFVVKPRSGSCMVIEQSQFYSVSGGIRRGPVRTARCQPVGTTTPGGTLNCNGKTTVFPAGAATAAG
jgi:hypothetical protein